MIRRYNHRVLDAAHDEQTEQDEGAKHDLGIEIEVEQEQDGKGDADDGSVEGEYFSFSCHNCIVRV